jgi:DNA-binding response OmpR family regulator
MHTPLQHSKEDMVPAETESQFGPITLDHRAYRCFVGDGEVFLTKIEWSLLSTLISDPGRVYERETLLGIVWGYEWFGGTALVDVHMSNLRLKLAKSMPGTKFFHTVRGVGFRMADLPKGM